MFKGYTLGMDLCQQYDNSPKFPGKYHTDQHSRGETRKQGRVRKMWVITAALLMLLINLAFSIDQSLMLRAARVMGAPAVEGLLAWQKMHNSTAALPESAKINAVNRFSISAFALLMTSPFGGRTTIGQLRWKRSTRVPVTVRTMPSQSISPSCR